MLVNISRLLHWDGCSLYLGKLEVGCIHHHRDGQWQARDPYIEGRTFFDDDIEARAAVEAAVCAALTQ